MAPEDDTLNPDPNELPEDDAALTSDETDADGTAAEEEEEKEHLDLEVEVQKPSACERHIIVTISREDIDRYLDEAYSELMPQAAVPGFRPGRAPRKLVENRFRKQVGEQVKGKLVMASLEQISEEHDLSAISEPDFDYDAIDLPDEGPMSFEFDLEVRPEFDLPDWKGLELERPNREFTKEDIDRHLDRLRERNAELAPHDGPAEPGDYVVANITVRRDGDRITRSEEQTIRVQPTVTFHDARIDDFDNLMAGAGEGERREATVTLSEDAPNENLRGQDVRVIFDVLDVKRLELPEMDDAFFRSLGFDSEGAIRDAIEEELTRQLAYHRQRRIREQIIEKLSADLDFGLPPDLLERQSRRELERATMELRSAGFGEDDIRAHENELRQNARATTAAFLKEHFLLERIAEAENIEVTDEDYDKEIALMALQSGESPRRMRAQIENRGQMDVLHNQIIERKAIELISSHAKFTEVPFDPQSQDRRVEAVDLTLSREEHGDLPEAKPGAEPQPLPGQPARE